MFGSTINNKGKMEKNKKVKAGACIFPFTYKWKNYEKCFPTDKGKICATSIKNKKRRTLKTYGYCKKIKIKKIKNTKLTLKKIDKTKSKLIRAKTIKIRMPKKQKSKTMILNKSLIDILGKLEELMNLKGEVFRGRAYHKAAEAIMLYNKPITEIKQLKGQPGIGKTILIKLEEFVKTKKIKILEDAKNNPLYLFPKIYGIGPKKANKLVANGITTLTELKKRKDEVLNPTQIAGLKYFKDIQKRIPRAEINEYQSVLEDVFKKINHKGSHFEIVGSYRRGAKDSGDIDIIITNEQNDNSIFKTFIDVLEERGILIHFFTRGKIKSLTMGQLKGQKPRRLDFMYAPFHEYAFATLYFTGSKAFNVIMRQRALDIGFSMNEHGLYKMEGRKKGAKLDMYFPTEQSIFQFLKMEYKTPIERVNGTSSVILSENVEEKKQEVPVKRKLSLKNIKIKKIKKSKFLPRKALIALKNDGISALKELSEEKLSKMIMYANDAYYNKKPVINDNIFDILKEYIQRNYPNNIAITEVGAPIKKNKVALPYYMGSMEKIKPDTGALSRWKKKYNGECVVSAKLDGMSIMYSTEGDIPKLYSRGAATHGLDLSHMIPYLKLPSEKGITIRGELIIPVALFDKKYKGKGYKSARNFVGGVMNSVGRGVSKWKDLDLVAYEVIKPELKPSEQMKWLEKNNIITVKNTKSKKINNEYLSELLVDWRSTYKYEIDGIIVINDKIYPRENKNPAHAFAFKMVLSDQVAEVKVIDVNYSISKYGYLKPVIQIEPVHIRGADIEFATAHNIKNVIDNNIGIGAIVQLSRSGDVIPKIEKVIVPAEEPKLPDVAWKWNETHVDALLKDFASNEEVRNKNIISFFAKLNTTGFGPGNITKVIENGFDTIPKILKMTIEDFEKIPGFQITTAKKVYNGIKDKIDNVSLSVLMDASNTFGRGMGESRISAVLDVYPNILTMEVSSEEKEILVRKIEGFAEKTAYLFITHIPEFLEFIKETGLQSKLNDNKKLDESHPLYDKKILLTGFRDKELETKIKSHGGKIATSVSNKLFMVLVPSIDANTSKIEKARKKKLKITTPDIFIKKYL